MNGNSFIWMGVGAALQVLAFAALHKLYPKRASENAPTVTFAAAQFALLLFLALVVS
jgi:hypothetical protein